MSPGKKATQRANSRRRVVFLLWALAFIGIFTFGAFAGGWYQAQRKARIGCACFCEYPGKIS